MACCPLFAYTNVGTLCYFVFRPFFGATVAFLRGFSMVKNCVVLNCLVLLLVAAQFASILRAGCAWLFSSIPISGYVLMRPGECRGHCISIQSHVAWVLPHEFPEQLVEIPLNRALVGWVIYWSWFMLFPTWAGIKRIFLYRYIITNSYAQLFQAYLLALYFNRAQGWLWFRLGSTTMQIWGKSLRWEWLTMQERWRDAKVSGRSQNSKKNGQHA